MGVIFKKILPGLILLSSVLTGTVAPKEFSQAHQFGGRFGILRIKDAALGLNFPGFEIQKDGTLPYIEFFYQPRWNRYLSLDLSFGAVGRGEVRYIDQVNRLYFFSSVNVYPISVGVNLQPLAFGHQPRFFPVMRGGGTFAIATESDLFGVGSKTQSAFGVYLAPGLDVALGSFFFTAEAGYRTARFRDPVGGIKDYSGVFIGLGVGYSYSGRVPGKHH